MKFHHASLSLNSGSKVRRKIWSPNVWIRAIDLYLDKEFSITELEGSEGTWIPFIVHRNVENKLKPWEMNMEDLMADDWEVVGS
jgi:hypothetical protein